MPCLLRPSLIKRNQEVGPTDNLAVARIESRYVQGPSIQERVEEDRASPRLGESRPRQRLTGTDEGEPLQLVRLGDGPDILLPGRQPEEIHRYLGALRHSGLFKPEDAHLAKLAKLPASRARSSDGKLRVGILLSQPGWQLTPGFHQTLSLHMDRVIENGGHPVLLPAMADLVMAPEKRAATLLAQAKMLDGMVGPGGADVDPRIYGAKPSFSLSTNYERDRYEADLALAAMDSRCAMLGVCRSHQLWNAASGGTLHQDVQASGRTVTDQNQLNHGLPLSQPFVLKSLSGKTIYSNDVVVAKGSDVAATIGNTHLVPNSLHHQVVATPGAFRVVGVAPDSDTGKRSIEMTERWNAMTMQFHPEFMPSDVKQRALYGVFGRRAEIFHMVREQGPRIDVAALERRMRDSGHFIDTDFRWVRANATRLTR